MRSRKLLLAAFLRVNESRGAGDPHRDEGHAAFDAVNEKYGLHGRNRVRTLMDALKICAYRDGRTWKLDLATLNETIPAIDVGGYLPHDAGTEQVPEQVPAWVTDMTVIDESADPIARAWDRVKAEQDALRQALDRIASLRAEYTAKAPQTRAHAVTRPVTTTSLRGAGRWTLQQARMTAQSKEAA